MFWKISCPDGNIVCCFESVLLWICRLFNKFALKTKLLQFVLARGATVILLLLLFAEDFCVVCCCYCCLLYTLVWLVARAIFGKGRIVVFLFWLL